jgi:hypothetical protein
MLSVIFDRPRMRIFSIIGVSIALTVAFSFTVRSWNTVSAQGEDSRTSRVAAAPAACGPTVVGNSNDSGANSLRDIIANACDGATITFDITPGHVTSPITLTSGELVVNKSLTFQGPTSPLTISGNSSSRVFNVTVSSPGTVTITNLTISNGNSGLSSAGGGIFNGGSAILNVVNSTLRNNSGIGSSAGGAIANTGTLTIINSTLSNNSARTGGAIINEGAGTLDIVNSTIVENNAQIGSGIRSQVAGAARMRNTIVALNTEGTLGPDLLGAFVSDGHNLIGTNTDSTGFTNGVNGDIVGTSVPIDPRVGALADNGGPTQTRALLPGSPALDAGDNCVTDVLHCGDAKLSPLATDQRGPGFSRAADGPDADNAATVDIGAFEAQVSLEDIPDKTTNEDTQLQFTFGVGGDSITSVTATSSNTTLVPNVSGNINVSGSGSTRTLTINPVANLFGTSTITVTVNVSSGQTAADTFVLTVNSVNDAPSFTIGPNQTVNNDAGPQTVANWATNISAGPANESGQTLTFQVASITNAQLFEPGSLRFDTNGTLSYTPLANAGGTSTIGVRLFDNGGTANGGSDLSPVQTFTITVVPVAGFISFTADTSSTTESSGATTVTVVRSGDTSKAVTVDYGTNTFNELPCSLAQGVATPRCDFTTTLGTLSFAANETMKTITVLISQDSFVEGPEFFYLSLSNPTGGSALGTSPIMTITITDDMPESPANPIDDPRNFVRQHYHDFLNREPDPSGWDFWTNQITSCGSDVKCNEVRRVDVSASFFLSIEFQQTGYLVERFYKVAYGDTSGGSTFGGNQHELAVPAVRANEFLTDTQRIGRGVIVLAPGWEQLLESNKQAYALGFVQTARFASALPTTMTPSQFVTRLNLNAGGVLTLSEQTTVIDLFGGTPNTSNTTARAQAVRMVADDQDLYNAEFNRAFVLAEYFGYLRRNPNDTPDTDYTGYEFWLTKLNQFNGNYINAEMVKAFLSSIEYRQRFGP